MLKELIPSDTDFDDAFDRFEYMFTLIHFDLEFAKSDAASHRAPVGRFVWRGRGFRADGIHVSEMLADENDAQGDDWLPIRDRVFASSDRFRLLNETYRENVLSKIEVF